MTKETINKILEDIEKVKIVIQNVGKSGQFPEIERDIAMSKLRNIYEFIMLIQPTHESNNDKRTEAVVSSKRETIIKKEEVIVNPSEVKDEPESKDVKPKHTESSLKNEILAEKFQTTSNFTHDVLTRYVNTYDISKKLQNQPINDIFKSIGLNEKFLFIKELFNNDSDLYAETIDKLNKAGNFNNAVEYIDSNFIWDFENNAVQKLLELVRRRFPSES